MAAVVAPLIQPLNPRLQTPRQGGRHVIACKEAWYRLWHWLCARIYFDRITVLHPGQIPQRGPVLYLGLHRNGAVDGFVYRQAIPRCVFLISAQLLGGFFARIFFCGIAVRRTTDAAPDQPREHRQHNDEALQQCVDLLENGGALFAFPEGTSSLGPRHLPFKSGAPRIALAALERGIPLRIIPVGIHYERAWAFRSRVEVIAGQPIAIDLPAGLSESRRLQEIKRRITAALADVGVNFESANALANAERFAYAATLGTSRSYFEALKSCEKGAGEPLGVDWNTFEQELGSRSCAVLRHQGWPLFSAGSWFPSALWLIVLSPVVVAGALMNFPPLLAGWLAARRFADERNVIALWRILIGLPLLVLWLASLSVTIVCSSGWPWMVAYVALTLAALKGLHQLKKVAVIVWNELLHHSLAGRARELHQLIRRTFHSRVSDLRTGDSEQSDRIKSASVRPRPEPGLAITATSGKKA